MDRHYEEYHERLSDRIEGFVEDKHKNILIFGNKFKKLDEIWKRKKKNVVYLDSLKEDWTDFM